MLRPSLGARACLPERQRYPPSSSNYPSVGDVWRAAGCAGLREGGPVRRREEAAAPRAARSEPGAGKVDPSLRRLRTRLARRGRPESGLTAKERERP